MTGETQLWEQSYLQLKVEDSSWDASRAMKQWPSSAPVEASCSFNTDFSKEGRPRPCLENTHIWDFVDNKVKASYSRNEEQNQEADQRLHFLPACLLRTTWIGTRHKIFPPLRQVQGNCSGLCVILNKVLKLWLCLGHRQIFALQRKSELWCLSKGYSNSVFTCFCSW